MKVCGIDPSLTSTGIDTDGNPYTIGSKRRGVERLDDLAQQVMTKIIAAAPDIIVIENYSYGSGNQAHQVGEWGGVLRRDLWRAGFRFVVVAPAALKKYATGKGNAGKDAVVSAVSARTGMVFDGAGANDKCDAWVLRQMGLAHYEPRHAVKMPALHLAALDKVEWPKITG